MEYEQILKSLALCNHSNLDPDLYNRWLHINTRMKTLGIKAYVQETKDAPRYF